MPRFMVVLIAMCGCYGPWGVAPAPAETRQPAAAAATAKPSLPQALASDVRWMCTVPADSDGGMCFRDRDQCDSYRTELNKEGFPHGECLAHAEAACFENGGFGASGEIVALRCYPTMVGCRHAYDYTRLNNKDHPVVRSCAVVE